MAHLVATMYNVLGICVALTAFLHFSTYAANFGTIATITYAPNSSVLRTSISYPPLNLCDATLVPDFRDSLLSANTTSNGGTPPIKVVIIASLSPPIS